MRSISFLFLFIISLIISCKDPSQIKNKNRDSIDISTIRTDTFAKYSYTSQTKGINKNDTLVPEKISPEKIIGVYNFYYGNWGFDLEITNKKIGERMSMPDTLDEGWIGTWIIKNDTLIAKGHSCSGGNITPMIVRNLKLDTFPSDYYYSLDYEIKMMDDIMLNGWKSEDDDDFITKFILVKGNLVELDDLDEGDLFPEVLTRIH